MQTLRKKNSSRILNTNPGYFIFSSHELTYRGHGMMTRSQLHCKTTCSSFITYSFFLFYWTRGRTWRAAPVSTLGVISNHGDYSKGSRLGCYHCWTITLPEFMISGCWSRLTWASAKLSGGKSVDLWPFSRAVSLAQVLLRITEHCCRKIRTRILSSNYRFNVHYELSRIDSRFTV